MNISAPGASDPYAAAAALDRQLRSADNDPGDSPSASAPGESGPDVVVTLSQGGGPASPATYDASGRMSRGATLDDRGANASDSMAKATESDGDASPDADGSTVDDDAAVAA